MTEPCEGVPSDVLTVYRPVGPDEPQMLMRRVSDLRGWWLSKSCDYELRSHPDGRNRPAAWVKITSNPERELPGRLHTTDWHDIRSLAERAWTEQDDRFVAWAANAYLPS